MKIKMVDIARHLGVSKATVSLAVNGKPGVNEETRRMVLECLEEIRLRLGQPILLKGRGRWFPCMTGNDRKRCVFSSVPLPDTQR